MQRRTSSSGQQILLKRVCASEHFPNMQVIANPAGTEKMSEVIFRFAEPFKDAYGMVPKEILEIAIILWNASFMPSAMQRKAVEDVVNVLPSENTEARRELFVIVQRLLERKKQYFSDNQSNTSDIF